MLRLAVELDAPPRDAPKEGPPVMVRFPFRTMLPWLRSRSKPFVALVLILGFTVYGVVYARSAFGQTWSSASQMTTACLLAALALGVVQNVAQSTRLFALLRSSFSLRWVDVFVAFSSGQLVNTFVPARACGG